MAVVFRASQEEVVETKQIEMFRPLRPTQTTMYGVVFKGVMGLSKTFSEIFSSIRRALFRNSGCVVKLIV